MTIGDDPEEMGDALPTVNLGTSETAVEVTTASQHTCALLASGGVKCWGRGFYGNLGLESYRARCVTAYDTCSFVFSLGLCA